MKKQGELWQRGKRRSPGRRLLSMFLVLCMVLTMLPVSAMAEEAHTNIGVSGEIIAFEPLAEIEKTVTTGTSIKDLELPETLAATVRTSPDFNMQADTSQQTVTDRVYGSEYEEILVGISVTWISLPEYDMDTEGEYVFTPVIEGYTVSAELPEITVTVGAADIAIYKYLNFEPSPNDAKIMETNQEYATLSLAFNAVKEGQTIQLLRNIEYTSTYYIGAQSFTLDLNNFTIKGTGYITIRKNEGGTLTITDGSAEKGGKITNAYAGSSPTISIGTEGSSLEVRGGTVEGTSGHAIFSSTTGSVHISGGSVINTGNGYAIYNSSTGTVEISGNSTANAQNTAAIRGFSGGKIIVGGGAKVTSANTSTNRGTIEVPDGAVLEITGGTIENTDPNGYAIYAYGNSRVLIGTPIIQGGGKAMNKAPDLSGYANVKVTASVNYDGSLPEAEYKAADIANYKYLAFAPATGSPVSGPELNLTDILAAPVVGGTPVTSIGGSTYTGTVAWNGSPTRFLGSTAYTATVTLTAKEGYTFSGVALNAFIHDGATVTNTRGFGGVLTVTVKFPLTAAKTVEFIAITTPPSKLVYKFGERFSFAGIVVKATYNDGTEGYLYTYLYDKSGPLTMSDTLVTITAVGTNISATQEITVTRADGPAVTGVSALDCTTVSNNDGKLIGVTTAMEYKKSDAASYIPGTGSDITGLINGTYLVRVKETATHEAGRESTFTVGVYVPAALTGNVTISGTLKYGQTLTAAYVPGNNSGTLSYQWKRGGTDIGTNSNTYTIVEADINNTLTCEVTSDVQTSKVSGSTASVINKADGPAVTGVSALDCTTVSNNDGKLIGVTTAMEYKKSGDAGYTPGPGGDITGLTSGTYLVRVKETITHNEGADSSFTVGAYVPVPSPAQRQLAIQLQELAMC
ncbi:hypothetical protein N752_05955 [Desulforamulus aquiferis]|nr:hypothetical protein [Desulforamulus aquiferis]RYD06070.1 hypothetical protein N752_05955 [Desulforamulus aquiferis]